MKIVIIRHAEPDYEHDSLTEKGWREAKFLSNVVPTWDIKDIYCSVLGRAKATASLSLEKMGRTAIECEWLREFHAPIRRPDCPDRMSICWDFLPQDWMNEPRYFNLETCFDTDVMKEFDVKKQYDWVIENFDKVIEEHGYKRNGNLYEAVEPNNDTIVMFCHFGLECVLLSRLLNISPMVLWHATAAAPSSITTVVTEERRPGIAAWRMLGFGETSHLFANNEEPSFAARFRECYTNDDQRLD